MESQASTPHSNGALPTLAPFHHGLKLLVRTPLRSALIKPCAPASVLAPLLVRRIPRTNTSTSLNVTLTAIKPAERTRLFWSSKWTCPEAHGRQASTALVLDCRLAVSSNAAVGRPVQRTCVLSLKCSSKTDLRCNDDSMMQHMCWPQGPPVSGMSFTKERKSGGRGQLCLFVLASLRTGFASHQASR